MDLGRVGPDLRDGRTRDWERDWIGGNHRLIFLNYFSELGKAAGQARQRECNVFGLKELVSLCRKDVDAKVLELAILYFFFSGDGQVCDYGRNIELIINPLKDYCRIVHRYPKVHTHFPKISA